MLGFTKIIWVCSECGSQNVEIKQWVNPNTDKVMWDLMEIEDDIGETWCHNCEAHTGITDLDDYKTTV